MTTEHSQRPLLWRVKGVGIFTGCRCGWESGPHRSGGEALDAFGGHVALENGESLTYSPDGDAA